MSVALEKKDRFWAPYVSLEFSAVAALFLKQSHWKEWGERAEADCGAGDTWRVCDPCVEMGRHADQRAAEPLPQRRSVGEAPRRAQVGRAERGRGRQRRPLALGGRPLRRESRRSARSVGLPVRQLRRVELGAGAQARSGGQHREELRRGPLRVPASHLPGQRGEYMGRRYEDFEFKRKN